MKKRYAACLIPVLLLSGCAGLSAEQAAQHNCADKANERLSSNFTDAEIKSETTAVKARQSDEVEAFDTEGQTTVQQDGDTDTYTWTCFGQRSEGKDYAAIQSVSGAS
jgi:PBP1b-binding outer membrane lipoprotein LpoB